MPSINTTRIFDRELETNERIEICLLSFSLSAPLLARSISSFFPPNKKRRRQNEDRRGDWKWNRLVFSPSKKFSGLWGLGGRVSGEVKTDERKTSPLISVKLLPRSSLCENNTIESIHQHIHWITATCGVGAKVPSFNITGPFQHILSSLCENNTDFYQFMCLNKCKWICFHVGIFCNMCKQV